MADVQSVKIEDAAWKCCSVWGWSGEVLIRAALAAIYGASYFFNEPFIRHVEGLGDKMLNFFQKLV